MTRVIQSVTPNKKAMRIGRGAAGFAAKFASISLIVLQYILPLISPA